MGFTPADTWAALTLCGELAFGVLLAIGLFTPVAACGAMFHNANYKLMKGFVSHSAYTDKTFFAAELFCLITGAGLAYGLDAALRHHVPAWVAATFMGGAPSEEPASSPIGQPEPRPA